MDKESRNFYVLLTILVVLTAFILYSIMKGDKTTFKDVLNQTHARLDSINMEIVKSRKLIDDTHTKLETIQKDMGEIRTKQGNSNANVSANDQQLKKELKEKERELYLLKNQYGKIKAERDVISEKLDSLADIIGGIEL